MTQFITHKSVLRENYQTICSMIKHDRFFYALKANGAYPVLKVLNEMGVEFEISSQGELNALKSLCVCPERIISSIPVKTVEFVKQAYHYGVRYFVFDCREELSKLQKHAAKAKKVMRLYISDLDPESCRWGITIDELGTAFNAADIQEIDGLAIHISRNYQTRLIGNIFDRIEKALSLLNNNKKLIVNIGGGFYHSLPKHLSVKYNLDEFYLLLNQRIRNIITNYDVTVYCEPGRVIVDTACDIHTKVEHSSKRNGINYIAVDLNLYKLGTLPKKIFLHDNQHEKRCIYDENKYGMGYSPEYYRFINTVCEWTEVLCLPLSAKPEEGDTIELKGVGAYSIALGSDFHLRERMPCTVHDG